MNQQEEILEKFGNKLRLRVCGICIEQDQILVVKHNSIVENGYLWAPPGGGMLFGESAEDCLRREFKEETGLKIKINNFLFINEFLKPPLHGMELFFAVEILSGHLLKGYDPEISSQNQIIADVKFLPFSTLKKENPHFLHALFNQVTNLRDILEMQGYHRLQVL